jgi:hypothetical protein
MRKELAELLGKIAIVRLIYYPDGPPAPFPVVMAGTSLHTKRTGKELSITHTKVFFSSIRLPPRTHRSILEIYPASTCVSSKET